MLACFLLVLLSQLPAVIESLAYRCDNDQVLIVQSFGNDTIRMHCQRLSLCGYDNLVSSILLNCSNLSSVFQRCSYEGLQPQCGGKTNFVAHVTQMIPTGP